MHNNLISRRWTDICIQPWCNPLWSTGLRAPTNQTVFNNWILDTASQCIIHQKVINHAISMLRYASKFVKDCPKVDIHQVTAGHTEYIWRTFPPKIISTTVAWKPALSVTSVCVCVCVTSVSVTCYICSQVLGYSFCPGYYSCIFIILN